MNLKKIEPISWIFMIALLILICFSFIKYQKEKEYTKEYTNSFEVAVQEHTYYSEDGKIVITETDKDQRTYDLKDNISSCTETLLNNIPGIYMATALRCKVFITKSKAVDWEELDYIIIKILNTKGCENEETNEYFEHFDNFIIDDRMFKDNV